jgi:transcription antitermination factor NusG
MFAAQVLDDYSETHGIPNPAWFAVQTRPRHEKSVASQLEASGFDTFAPTIQEVHSWSDRRKKVLLPLFPRYTFVKFQPTAADKVRILRTYGVHSFVGGRGQGTPIPDKQIADIQTLIERNIDFSLNPFFAVGQRVRIRGGCLDGIEGILTAKNSDHTLSISVEPIQQSLSIRIDGHQVEPI